MNYSQRILNSLLGLSLGVTIALPALAQMPHGSTTKSSAPATQQFQRIEQPLWTKLLVAGAGMGLVGLELWWFVWSQPEAHRSEPMD